MLLSIPRGARTPACRVHTRVNAFPLTVHRCSHECEHGTQECVRHGFEYIHYVVRVEVVQAN